VNDIATELNVKLQSKQR